MKLTNHVARLVPCDQHLYSLFSYLIYVNNVSPGKLANVSLECLNLMMMIGITHCHMLDQFHILVIQFIFLIHFSVLLFLLGCQLGTVIAMPISGILAFYSWDGVFYLFGRMSSCFTFGYFSMFTKDTLAFNEIIPHHVSRTAYISISMRVIHLDFFYLIAICT